MKIKSIVDLLAAREALQASLFHINRAIQQRVEDYVSPADEDTSKALESAKLAVVELERPAILEVS
jgi:hypothetical protein